MLADIWPIFRLRIETPRLVLRLPEEPELVALADLAAAGVHRPDERPFLTPWAEGSPQDRTRSVLQGHWGRLADWEPDSWSLGLGAFTKDAGEPRGLIGLRANDFRVVREVSTWSWIGLAHQGQGLGTELRHGILTLAFDHLGALDATTGVFQDNHASQGVSRKLGYEHDGITRDRRGEEWLVSDRLRLTKDRWDARAELLDITVTGLEEESRALFG
ncbi:GNAT family N-acetyltransferase [Knoellia koreensis]|uniref:GNAT family N-acetyltransferase n=1 Tax=Knoellia koreensis TaxID=2730921 RepID=UPI001980572D